MDSRRSCVCRGLAALSVCIAAPARAGSCVNDAGAGDIAEGEVCLVDLGQPPPGPVTDGCNLLPNTFHEVPDAELADGMIAICGIASNYNANEPCDTNLDCLDGNCQGDPNPGDGIAEGICVGPSEPSVNRRDSDWHRISAAALAALDVDGNGVVQIHSLVLSEFDSVTFMVSIGNPTCATVTVLNSVGCGGPQTAGNPVEAIETIELDNHRNGMVVFVAPGMCSGQGIFDGYECGDVPALNDYTLTILFSEPPTACADPDVNPDLLPCNTPNPGQNGCNDPDCCKLVCLELPLCCLTGWGQNCVEMAIDLGCVIGPDGPACPATGPSSADDGYLQVCTDPLGGWADLAFGGAGDRYNPFGNNASGVPLPPQPASFSNAFFLYRAAQQQRELLSNNPAWKSAGFDDASLATQILCVLPGPNCIPGSVATDVHGNDGVVDHLVSKFKVTGVGVDLTFDLTQDVQHLPGPQVSVLSQVYSITNNTASTISFVLLRQVDYDIVWQGSFGNDSVGTGTNGSPLDRHVSQGENPAAGSLDHTYITLSSPQGNQYVGAKSAVDPDGAGPGPPMGGGAEWAAYGVPQGWGNFAAYVGYDTNGYSGTQAGDAWIDLEVPVTIDAGATVVVNMDHTYGSKIPLGAVPCPWDCAAPPNGLVDTVDFLELLALWGVPGGNGPCDFDGNGLVDTVDFLDLLAHWGACPEI